MLSFKRLRRGVKLLAEHLTTPITAVLNLLTSTGVTEEHLKSNKGSFRLNFYFPVITGWHKDSGDIGNGFQKSNLAAVPFVLPPLQEYSDAVLGIDTQSRPRIFLEEVSLSTDSRCEPQILHDYFDDVGNPGFQTAEGDPDKANQDKLGYKLYIFSKEFSQQPERFTNAIYKMDIDRTALNQGVLRLNPYVQSDLGINMDPDKSYLIEFACTHPAYFSVMASLKFSHRLVPRDSGADIQNIPHHNGTFSPSTQTITVPNPDDPITASTAGKGVDVMFDKVDEVFRNKLKGGYTKYSDLQNYGPGAENILDCSSYEVIAVNLFNGFWCVRGGSASAATTSQIGIMNIQDLPYLATAGATTGTLDRRIVPLNYPMTIHHVFAAISYGTPATTTAAVGGNGSRKPIAPNYTNSVGVGLMTGIRSDQFTYDQVAHTSWTPATLGSSGILLDSCAQNITSAPSALPVNGGGYFWDIVNIPLVGTGGQKFRSAFPNQGKPIFAGQALHGLTGSRRNLNGAAPNCNGAEQALEIRWSFKDTDANGMSDSARYNVNETLVGMGGHWVFIYGKKHLV